MTNITGLTNGSITSFYDMIKFNNSMTNDLFSGLFLISLTFIFLVQILKRSEPKIAFMVTSFIMLILSLIFVSINLANPLFVFMFALMLIFSVIYNYSTNK